MSRVLLIVPYFMGYENKIKNVLQFKYEVDMINDECFGHIMREKYLGCCKFRWWIRHFFRAVAEYDQEKAERVYLDALLSQIHIDDDAYDFVFAINGAYIPNDFYRFIKKKNPKARFVYYAWDDINNLIKTSHIKLFDETYAYNIDDCRKYNAVYLPMFVQSEKVGHNPVEQYDLAFIASAHSDRKKVAAELDKRYGKKYRLFIHLFDAMDSGEKFCSNKGIDYEDYLDIMRKSKAVLDVPHIKQKGPTTRAFDALLTKTKVITVNSHMKEYPVYSENIWITDRKNIEINEDFINSPYIENPYEPLTISQWLKKIGL